MSEINSKLNQEECNNTMKLSADHTAEGKRYLEKGLKLIKNGEVSKAADAFLHAAVEFEKDQDFRQIPALWEAIGKLSELKGDSIPHVTEKWPLDYHIMETDEWNSQKDMMHKLSWVYQWAAEHRERIGNPHMAYPLFFKSAEKAEQTKHSKNDQIWPAKLYHKAALNFIRTYGTIENAPVNARHIEKGVSDKVKIKQGIKEAENHYLRIKNRSEAYRLLAISHRLLRSNLIEMGNLEEARGFRKKERSALMHYYFHRRSYLRAVIECLAGSGFKYFIIGLLLMILVIFPCIYYYGDFVIPLKSSITYRDAFLYSIESALGIGHNEFYAIGFGKLLNIVEAALSWLGLGVFIWWLTRRLE